LELYGIIVSVKADFLRMDICILYSVLFTEFVVLFDSISAVKCRLGGVELKSVKVDCISLGGTEDEKNVIHVTEVVYDHMFFS